MTYFHLLPKEEAKEALLLSNAVFQKKYSRPSGCDFFGALDKEFGCPFLFKYKKAGIDIKIKCVSCTCGERDLSNKGGHKDGTKR